MTTQRTPWFNALKHRPVRVGWYEFFDTLYATQFMAHWNGTDWCAYLDAPCMVMFTGDKWRGLTEETK